MAELSRMPRLEKILQFRTSFLKMLTKTARDMHVRLIVRKSTNPDGKKFKKLTREYKIEKAQKYNSTKPNLRASGLLFDQFQPHKPEKIGSAGVGGPGSVTNILLSYGIKGGARHPRRKGSIPSFTLMEYHQDGTKNMPARDIAGEKVLHNATRDKVVSLLVNQINLNIEGALAPFKADLTL